MKNHIQIQNHPNYGICANGKVINLKNNRILSGSKDKDGYLRVSLDNKSLTMHRLVAENFIPNPKRLPIINHKDGNKQNNLVDNLEWVTHSQNVIHAYATGLAKGRKKEFSDSDIETIFTLRTEFDVRAEEIAEFFGVSVTLIRQIIAKRR
jgi:hypothetical protein